MKLCLIGKRGHTAYVFQSIAEVPEVTIEAVSSGCAEDDPQGLIDESVRAGFHPAVYDDWRRMLDEVHPDVVSVDGPFDHHAEMCVEALKRGIHVFCEKPIALTLGDLDRIREAQKQSGAKIVSMVGLRYDPAFQYAAKLVHEGKIGKLKIIRAQKSYKIATRPDFYKKRETYGGTIPWVGSHAMDWILYFSGEKFLDVSACQNSEDNFDNGTMEVTAHCQFNMTNGVIASASIDYLRPMSASTWGDDRVRAAGTKGVLEVRDSRIFLIDASGESEIPVPPPERQLFSDFIRDLQGKGRCLVDPAQTFELTEGCLLSQLAADQGQIIRFPSAELK